MENIIKKVSFILLAAFILLMLPTCDTQPKEIMFRVQDGYIQWKYSTSDGWNNIISVADLNESAELQGFSAYDIAVAQGFEGTEEEWLASLRGESGDSVYIGANNNWWIGDTDTGVSIYNSSSEHQFIPVPNFFGMTAEQILPYLETFSISFEGEVSNSVVISQSIPAGVAVIPKTAIVLQMDISGSDDFPTSPSPEPSKPTPSNPTENSTSKPTAAPSDVIPENPPEASPDAPSENPSEGTQENPSEQSTDPISDIPTEAPTAKPPAVVNYTPELIKGETGTIRIHGISGHIYRIRVYYSESISILSSNASKASGLEDKYADEYGYVSWTWSISKNISEKNTVARIKIIDLSNDAVTTIFLPIVEAEKAPETAE